MYQCLAHRFQGKCQFFIYFIPVFKCQLKKVTELIYSLILKFLKGKRCKGLGYGAVLDDMKNYDVNNPLISKCVDF